MEPGTKSEDVSSNLEETAKFAKKNLSKGWDKTSQSCKILKSHKISLEHFGSHFGLPRQPQIEMAAVIGFCNLVSFRKKKVIR